MKQESTRGVLDAGVPAAEEIENDLRGSRMLYVRKATLAILAISGVTLSACGGGGGSSTPPPPNLSSAPGAAALNAYYQANHSTTLSTTYSGNTFSLRQDITQISGTVTFEGVTVNSATDALTLSENGTVRSSSTQTDYYTLNPFTAHGSVNSNGTEYEIVQTFGPIPTTIAVGQTGSLETATIYHDSTKAVIDGAVAATYSVSSDTPTTVALCTIGTVTANAGNPDGLSSGTQTNCYHVDASGNVTLFKVTVSVNGVTLTFQ